MKWMLWLALAGAALIAPTGCQRWCAYPGPIPAHARFEKSLAELQDQAGREQHMNFEALAYRPLAVTLVSNDTPTVE